MYRITSSEERNEIATEFETKSLLFAMDYYSNSDQIYWFVIDFFNDVSGVEPLATKCFDFQSKGVNDIQPNEMGRYLVTLFKNYLSEFNFADFILFMKSVSPTIKDEIGSKTTFSIDDLSKKLVDSIKAGLKDESVKKTYIDDKTKITDGNINDFLRKVSFVIDSHSKEQYIRDAVKLSSGIIIDDLYLRKIFKEIRDKQSSKKNNNCEGELLTSIECFMNYDKHIKKMDIENLIISRICFKSTLDKIKSVPTPFIDLVSHLDETIRQDEIEDCQNDIFRLLFDKNNKDAFWKLFSNVVRLVKLNPTFNIEQIYNLLDKSIINDVHHLNAMSCKFYIALVKEGIND